MYKRKYAHTYIFRETDKQADAVNMNRNFPRFPELCSPPPRMVYGRQMSASLPLFVIKQIMQRKFFSHPGEFPRCSNALSTHNRRPILLILPNHSRVFHFPWASPPFLRRVSTNLYAFSSSPDWPSWCMASLPASPLAAFQLVLEEGC